MNVSPFWRASTADLRRNPLSTLAATIILGMGFSGSFITMMGMIAFTAVNMDGIRNLNYVTIAQELAGGGSRPIDWSEYSNIKAAIGGVDPQFIPYSLPVPVEATVLNITRKINLVGTTNDLFQLCLRGSLIGTGFRGGPTGDDPSRDIILSYEFAKLLFSIPQQAIGRGVEIRKLHYRIVGVAPKGFIGLWMPRGERTDAWVTPRNLAGILLSSADQNGKDNYPAIDWSAFWVKVPIFYVISASIDVSQNDLQSHLTKEFASARLISSHLYSVAGLTIDQLHRRQLRFWTDLAFVLSIGLIITSSVNYSCILLTQVPQKIQEIRLKRVLGASTLRLIGENVCGPMFIVLAAILLASTIALTGIEVVFRKHSTVLIDIAPSWHTVWTAVGTSICGAIAIALLIALLPAFRLLRDSGVPQFGYTRTKGKSETLVLQGFVSVQIAACMLACTLAALIISSANSLSKIILGYKESGLTVVVIGPQSKGFVTESNDRSDFPMARFTRGILFDNTNGLPGSQEVAVAGCAPLTNTMPVLEVSGGSSELGRLRAIYGCGVTRDYFRTVGTSFYLGHSFTTDNLNGIPSEVIINRELAHELWSDSSPLGHILEIHNPVFGVPYQAEVVGVVYDSHSTGPENAVVPTLYLPLRGNTFLMGIPPLYVLIRGQTSDRLITRFLNTQIDANHVALQVNSINHVSDQLATQLVEMRARVYISLFGAALIAIVSYLGLYVVLVYFTQSRRREIAIRMCMGASQRDIRREFLYRSLQCGLAASGIAFLSGHMMLALSKGWLESVSWSWRLEMLIALVCVLLSIVISLLPARTAMTTALVEALKVE